MRKQLLRLRTPLAPAEVFRIASFLLYTALLLHIAAATSIFLLPTSSPAVIAALLLSVLSLKALARSMRPQWFAVSQRNVLVEFFGLIAVITIFAWVRLVPSVPLPWLIGMTGVFSLVFKTRLALLTALAAATGAFLFRSSSGDMPQHGMLYGTLDAAAILFTGFLSIVLSRVLSMHQGAIRQAHASERRFNAIARATRHVFIITDTNYQIKYANPALYDVIGYTQEELESEKIRLVVHPNDLKIHESKLRFLRDKSGSKIFSRHRIQHRNGHWVWLEMRGYNMLHDAAIGGLVFSVEDITAQKEAEYKLMEEHALLRAVLDLNPSMIYAKNIEGRFTISNARFQRQFGYSSEEDLQGKTVHDLLSEHTGSEQYKESNGIAEALHEEDMQVMQTGLPLQELETQGFWDNEERRWYLTNKYPLRDANDQVYGMLGITLDITERKEYELRLEHQALHDPLTSLPNRRYLLKKIGEHIASAPSAKSLAILFCDLDFFKSVNDTHGHDIGDKCLIEITRRIKSILSETDFMGRYGGDEFVILASESLQAASAKAQALINILSRPLIVGDVIVKLQASIGIAQLRGEHKSPSDVIRDADAAMYQAKAHGRNRAEIFSPSLQYKVTRRAQMDVALRFAQERDELSICYQPKVAFLDGSIKGFELLLRWNSHQYGEITPGEFIPIAEDSGLIIPIGLWALEQACWQLNRWQNEADDRSHLTIAVNVSMRQLLQPSFISDVQRILDRTGILPHSLELEVTETSAMANAMQTIENLSMLKRLGIRLALDDFGTGYSSLAYLQKLPIDVLKIDRAFVMGLGKDQNDNAIVRLILALAKTLNLETVAEGVETREQIIELQKLGCHIGQGHYYSRGVSPHEAEELLLSAQHAMQG